jgi:hypothetical protein
MIQFVEQKEKIKTQKEWKMLKEFMSHKGTKIHKYQKKKVREKDRKPI